MSIYYHGTTRKNARQIIRTGFRPKAPSRAVWFTKSWRRAMSRAKRKADKSKDQAVVLKCDLNVQQFHEQVSRHQIASKGSIIAIRAHVPSAVIISQFSAQNPLELPLPLRTTPKHRVEWVSGRLAEWLNDLLRLKPYKGVQKRDPGIERLAQWVIKHYDANPASVPPGALLQVASQWLPEYFDGVEIEPKTLLVHRTKPVKLEPEPVEEVDPREEETFDCLDASTPKRRIRGLELLEELGDADLFNWCAMYLKDESREVTIAALRIILSCDAGDSEVIKPLANSVDKRIRAAAIAALAKHSGPEVLYWIERGLKDREACVRLETAAMLPQLDATEHRDLFELVRFDPNPEMKRLARKMTDGKGFHEIQW